MNQLWIHNHFLVGLFEDYSKTIQRLFEDYSKTIWRLFEDYLKTIRRLFEDYSKTIRRLFEDYLKTIWRLFEDYLEKLWIQDPRIASFLVGPAAPALTTLALWPAKPLRFEDSEIFNLQALLGFEDPAIPCLQCDSQWECRCIQWCIQLRK